MLPLVADTLPASTEELTTALRQGFEAHGLRPKSIAGQGANFPNIESLKIDLTGAAISTENLPSKMGENGGAPVQVADFELVGDPISFLQTPLQVRVAGQGVQMLLAGPPKEGALKLEGARTGTVSVKAAIQDLEALLLSMVSELASKQGIAVKETKLILTQEGPCAIDFRAEVTAKVFIMSATLAVTGRLDIDDSFNARLSSLGLDGDPMVTGLAGSFLRPRLQQLEGRVFPLLAFSPGGLKLRNIEVSVKPDLRINAEFGE